MRLTPKGGQDAIDGIGHLADGRPVLLARVRAAPEDGKANAALAALVADSLGSAKSAVRIAAGDRARLKELRIDGDPALLLDTATRLWRPLGR